MELLRLLARQRLLKIGDKGIMTIATKEAVEREANNLALLLQKYRLDPSAFNDIGTLKRTIRGLEELDLAGGLQDLAKKKTDNVFDLKGRKIEDTKNIMGGEEFKEQSIKKNIDEATEKGDFKGIFNQVMRDPEIAEEFSRLKAAEKIQRERDLTRKLIPDRDIIPYQGKEIQKMTGPEKQKYLLTDDKQTAELLKRGYTFDDIIYAQDNYGLTAKEIMQEAKGATKKDPFPFASGGRVGLRVGSKMSKRAFLKLLAGLGITGAAAKSGIVSLGGKQTGKQVVKEVIKTPSVAGKPEWFDTLVNKVIAEGVDKTDDLAYKERMIVHTKKINPNEEVAVYQDLDDGSVRINVGSPIKERAVNDPDQIDLIVRKGKTEEGGFKTKDSFEASEAEPRVANQDGDIEFDGERVVDNVDDLMQDVSNLEEYATGKKLTGTKKKKAVEKQEKFQKFTEDQVEQAEYLENKYGPYDDSAMDDFASGGIAKMLGE